MRTINDIYNEIVLEKQNQTALDALLPASDSASNLLSDLTSDSKVAIWRLWAYTMAVAIWTHEELWGLFKIEVELLVSQVPTGTPRWYQERVFDFQFGDDLVYLDGKYQYVEIDEAAKVVKRCAIEERSDGVVLIKTAKEESNIVVPLSTPEIDALRSYLQKVKFAGTRLAVISFDADQLNIQYNIYYDPIIPLSEAQANVQTAVDTYFANLPFNGKVSVTKLTDAVQLAGGVIDPIFVSASATPQIGDVSNFNREYIPVSGYVELFFPVAQSFNFIQQVQ